MNKNYIKGRTFEYKAMADLLKEGYYPFRSAGSHKRFDVIAINERYIRLIQIKSVKGKYYSFKKEIKEIRQFTKHPDNIRKELWIHLGRMKGRKAQWKKQIIKS